MVVKLVRARRTTTMIRAALSAITAGKRSVLSWSVQDTDEVKERNCCEQHTPSETYMQCQHICTTKGHVARQRQDHTAFVLLHYISLDHILAKEAEPTFTECFSGGGVLEWRQECAWMWCTVDIGQIDLVFEQIHSRINNNWLIDCRTFWPHRALSTVYRTDFVTEFCTQLTKAYGANMSCNQLLLILLRIC